MESINAFIKKWEELHQKQTLLVDQLSHNLTVNRFSTFTLNDIKTFAEEVLELAESVGVKSLNEKDGKYDVRVEKEKFFELIDHREILNAYTELRDNEILYVWYKAKKNGVLFSTCFIEWKDEKSSKSRKNLKQSNTLASIQ